MMRFRPKFLLTVFACLTMSALAAAQDENDSAPPKEPEVNWRLLDFHEGRRLKSAHIEIRKNTGMNFRDGEIVAAVTVTDPAVLRKMESALADSWIKRPSAMVVAIGLTPTSMLECTTSDGKFRVYWNDSFTLESQGWSSANTFISPGLVTVIDEELRRAGKDGLSEKLIARLSGESILRGTRDQYRSPAPRE